VLFIDTSLKAHDYSTYSDRTVSSSIPKQLSERVCVRERERERECE
jgi:hypothetical protein